MSVNGLDLVDSEWMAKIESDYFDYFDHLYELLNEENYDEPAMPSDFEPLSGEPFCGCHICNLRETIVFLAPLIIRGYKDGKIELEK